MRVDGLTLKFPLVGKIFRNIAVARFCALSSPLSAPACPILDGLDITSKTAGNAVVEVRDQDCANAGIA